MTQYNNIKNIITAPWSKGDLHLVHKPHLKWLKLFHIEFLFSKAVLGVHVIYPTSLCVTSINTIS